MEYGVRHPTLYPAASSATYGWACVDVWGVWRILSHGLQKASTAVGSLHPEDNRGDAQPVYVVFRAADQVAPVATPLSSASMIEILIQHPVWASACAALLILLVDYAHMLYLRSKMPPGPFPWPIVGNTFQLPDSKPWIYFEQLSRRYESPLLTYWIGRNPTVWINDAWTASELLDKRASIYCSRPRMLVFAELGMGQKNLLNMYTDTQAGRDRWRIHRKLMHAGVGIQQVRKYRSFQDNESKVVALDLLSSPDKFVEHFERYATSVVSIIAFGRRVASSKDPIITEVIAAMHHAAALNVPGKTFPMLMETFPFLARIPTPLAPWKHGLGSRRTRTGAHKFFYALAHEAATTTATQPNNNHAADSFATHLVHHAAPAHALDAEEVSSLTGNLFGAGSDTSSSTLITFVLACCAFPRALPRAWDELDRVVGHGRSPGAEDEQELVYVRAFVREVLRWRSVAVIGGQPHAPVRDDYFGGWLIPRGAWVQGNVWAIHHHEREFPEPDRFAPERFLEGGGEGEGLKRPFPGERGYMTFGWGRRVCSGQALAEQGTWLSVARMLWGFRIEKARDAEGREVPVDIFDYTDGLNWRPRPFKCSFTPRSPEILQTIEREGKQALRDLEEYAGTTEYRMSQFAKRKQ
ncbi:cytochrome p450 [Diplodia corticola]|uniref:Cytochrome p450 n=1 Tax=Diplodia corticola TaxID=236234 RepID=A0A1J9RPT1_9PEZI|nr:cytochrome p450 [Diplodia corticola]OJD30471.1 cytochrome p450 [Diplodia corticola]